MKMLPKSNNLFHFTKNLEYLKSILLNGFMPRYSLEDGGPIKLDFIAYPMVCFCDIPISRIGDHTAFYGGYGLGMTKEWGLKNKLTPLIYTPTFGVVPDLANFLISYKPPMGNSDSEVARLHQVLVRHGFDLIPLVKPISGNMMIAGEQIEKDFSQESEWRYVPPHDQIFGLDGFESKRDEANKQMEEKRLLFTPSDVRYIFVKSDFEIPVIFDFIQTNLAQFPLNDIKILISRIVSLETLARDV